MHTDDPSQALYRAAIGPGNTDFYVSKFLRFDEPGSSKMSWSWPAFFFSFGWFLYRRMFREWGLHTLVIPIAMRLAAGIATEAAGLHGGYLIYDTAWLAYGFLVIPLNANAIYWRAIRRRIDFVKREVDAPVNQLAVLENGPHTSVLGWWVPVALVGISILGLLAGRAIPPYEAYVTRTQVLESLQLTVPVRAAVAEYYAAHRSWPATFADLGMAAPRDRHLSDVSVDQGTITIHYSPRSVHTIAGRSLSLRPTLGDHERVRWLCGRDSSAGDAAGVNQTTVAEGYLPPMCRRHVTAATH